jgi:hypothetical protein
MYRKSLAFSGLKTSAVVCLFVVTMIAVFSLSGCGGSSAPVSVAVAASATTVDATDAVTITATVTNDRTPGGVTWSVSGGGALSNETTTGATYTAPAASNSALTVTVTATSVADTSKSGAVTITVPAAPTVTTAALPPGAVGTAYSQALAASGGIPPYSWTLSSGTLPACLTMNSAGVISSAGTTSGAPTASCVGTSNLTFKVTDSGTATALSATSPALGLIINAAPALVFPAPGTLAAGTYNVAYSGSVGTTAGGAGAVTSTVTAGSLPTGLTLNSLNGAITGTPTAVGTFNFTIKAADNYGDSATQAYSITVSYPALKVTAATLPTGYVGSTYTATTLAATGGSGTGYSFALASGSSLPAGLSLSSAGVISGKPTGTPGPTNFTVTVTDSASNTGSGSFSITVNAAVSVTTGTTLPTGYVGSSYSQTLAATGGTGTGYSWAVASGSALPGGLTLSTGGVLSGTPTTAGTPSFTVTATDSAQNTASATFTITIKAGVSITTATTLPTAYVGASYSQTLAATGGSGTGYSWAVASGSTPPAGLALSAAGVLSGKPTAAGTPSFTVTVTDSAQNTASATFTITISAALAITNPATLPTGYVGSNYSQTLTAGGGSGTGYTFALAGGTNPPAGLTLSTSGAITGKPTTAGGPTSFTVTVTDSASNTANGTFAITIDPAVSITTGTTLPTGYVGSNYSQALLASGGSGTGYSWTVASGSTLPGGLTLSVAGAIGGKPTTVGTPSFTLTVTDSAGNTASATFSLTVGAGITINPTPLPTGYQGTTYPVTTLTATGGTGTGYTWTWVAGSGSSLPAGLSLSAGGVITGTPTAAGTFSVVITVTDSAGNTVSTNPSLVVQATLTISTSATLPGGVVATPYSVTLAATGGSGGYSWATNSAGTASLATINLTLSPAGLVSGIPAANGTATFTATVTDSASHTANVTFTVTVSNALTITTTTLPPTDAGFAYSQQLAAAGGSGTGYSWSTNSAGTASLAAVNLTLSSAGVVSGTPTAGGTATFTAKVTDSASNTATATLGITVWPALTLPAPNPASLGSAVISQSYSGTISPSGGSGSFSWTVTGLPAGLGFNSTGSQLTISGTAPSTAQTITLNVTVTDTVTSKSTGPIQYTIAVNPMTPLTLPSPNPSSLGSATAGQAYLGYINASGGSGSGYVFTVSGTQIPTTGSSVTIADGVEVSSTGGNTLTVEGVPTTAQTVPLIVSVKDGAGDTAGPTTYNLVVNTAPVQVNGQISLNNSCGEPSNPPTITVNLYTSPGGSLVQTTTTTGMNYGFASVPSGNYTITPSISGPSSIFYPATQSVTVTNSVVNVPTIYVSLGYTVSGAVTYTASGSPQSGQTYLTLLGGNCGEGEPGTSISSAALTSGGAFTIRGVPPGSYELEAWMDPLGQGLQNAIDPSGSSAVTVTNANVTNAAVTMTNPAFGTPTENPTISDIIPNAQGVLIEFTPSTNSNGIEDANGYWVQWSTSQALGGGSGGGQFSCAESGGTCPHYVFTANGDNGVWLLSNAVLASSGYSFASGQTYYFQARSYDSLDGNSHPNGWCNYTSSGCSGTTNFVGVTIGTPACTGTCTAVSGSVTIPSGITCPSNSSLSICPGAPLYLGLLQFSNGTGGSPSAIYAMEITSPVTGANNFNLTVPSGSNYAVFGILDQNNTGGIGTGAVTNVRNNVTASLSVSGTSQAVPNITLPNTNSVVQVQTQYTQSTSSSGSSSNYQLNFDVRGSNKLPVAVTLTSGPNLIEPLDLSNYCQNCGNPQFQYSSSIPGVTPNVGDTYDFTVTYSDGSHDTGTTVNGAVTGWNGTSSLVGASDLATNLAPSSSGAGTTPTFTWTYPANASDYSYSFWLCCASSSTIWEIPSNNSKSNGFTSAQIPSASIPWSTTTDPTGAANPPTVPSLAGGTTYTWQLQVQDSYGNEAQTQVNFEP